MTYKLLLIDNRIQDINVVLSSLLDDNIKHIIVDYDNDTLDSIKTKLINLNVGEITDVGIFQENYETSTYKFINSFQESIVDNVETQDIDLNTWNDFKNLLSELVTNYKVSNIDLMGCSIYSNPNWIYVIDKLKEQFNINIESSIDYTGNERLNGNWILESNNSNMVEKYFNSNIYNYEFILGSSGSIRLPFVYNNGEGFYYQNSNNPEVKYIDINGNVITGIVSITYGLLTDYILTNDGSVYSLGRNNNGSAALGLLGRGITTNVNIITHCEKIKIDANTDVSNAVQIASSRDHYAILLSTGEVLVGGSNSNGKTGQGITSGNLFYATYILNDLGTENITNVKYISLSPTATFMVLNDGTVWACGKSNSNIIDNTVLTRSLPIQLYSDVDTPINNAIKIAGGDLHVIILLDDGTVIGRGLGTSGQLANGGSNVTVYPTQLLLDANTYVTNVIDITANVTSSCVLLNDGTVWTCGKNVKGECGTGDTIQQNYLVQMKIDATTYITNVKQIDQSQYRTNMVLNDGTLKFAGNFLSTDQTSDQYYAVDAFFDSNNDPFTNIYSIIGYDECFYQKSKGTDLNTLKNLFTTTELKISGFTDAEIAGNTNSASSLYLQGYTIQQLIDSSYSTNEIITAGYSVNELYVFGYTASQIKNAGISNQLILTGGISSTDLKSIGYTSLDLFGVGYSVVDLQNANYTTQEICGVGYPSSELFNAGYLASDLFTAGYSITDLQNAGYTTQEICTSGYSSLELFNAGYLASDLFTAGYSITDLQNAGYTTQEICSAGYSSLELFNAGYLITDLFTAGYSITDLQNAGYTNEEIVNLGYTVQQLNDALFEVSLLRLNGFTIQQLKGIYTDFKILRGGYTASELFNAGYTAQQLINRTKTTSFFNLNIEAGYNYDGYSLIELRNAGYTNEEILPFWKSGNMGQYSLKKAGFTAYEVINGPTYFNNSLVTFGIMLNYLGYNIIDMITSGITLNEITQQSTPLQYYNVSSWINALNAGYFTLPELLSSFYNSGNVNTTDESFYNARAVKISFNTTAEQMRIAGYTIALLRRQITLNSTTQSAFTNDEILLAGYSAQELNDENFTPLQLKNSNYTATQMQEGGYTITELKSVSFTDEEILAAGFSVIDLKTEGYTITQLKDNNYTATQLQEGGYTILELQKCRIYRRRNFKWWI